MKPYSPYAYHSLRRYFRDEPLTTHADELNQQVCIQVCSEFDNNTQMILREIYSFDSILSVSVSNAARKYGIKINDLWTLIAKVERRFAKLRGLI